MSACPTPTYYCPDTAFAKLNVFFSPLMCDAFPLVCLQVVKVFCGRYSQLDQAGKEDLLLSMAR